MVLSTLRYRSFMRLGWHAAMQAVDGWGQRAVIMMLLQSMEHHDIEDGDGEEEIGRACQNMWNVVAYLGLPRLLVNIGKCLGEYTTRLQGC